MALEKDGTVDGLLAACPWLSEARVSSVWILEFAVGYTRRGRNDSHE